MFRKTHKYLSLNNIKGLTAGTGKLTIRNKKHGKKIGKKAKAAASAAEPVTAFSVAAPSDEYDSEREEEAMPVVARKKQKTKKGKKSRNALLLLVSFAFSLMLWMYIQVTTNPVTEKSFSLPLQYENDSVLKEKNLAVKYPTESVKVRLIGRKSDMDDLTSSDLSAYLDLSEIESTGSVRLNVNVKCDERIYFRVEMQNPTDIPVSVYTRESDEE